MSGNNDMVEMDSVRAAKAGDRDAFNRLIESHYNRIYFAAYSRMGNAASAEDIAQEVFLAAFLSLKSLENPAHFSLWLFSITRNICRNWIRSGQKQSRILESIPTEMTAMERLRDAGGESALRHAVSKEETARLHEAIQRLDPDLREIVLLRYAEDLNNTEIGLQLGLPHYTVSRRLDKACEILRGIMENDKLTCLAKLKPGRQAAAKAVAITAAVSVMSDGAKAALLLSLGEVIPVFTGEAAVAVSKGIAKAVPYHEPVISGGGKSFMGKFFATGFGKAVTVAVCAGAVIVGGNSIAKK